MENHPSENDTQNEINPNPANPPPLPAADDVQRVDAEPLQEPHYRYGHRANSPGAAGIGPQIHVFTSHSNAALSLLKPPTIATWICLAIAWIFLGSKLPFTVLLGVPFALVAVLLATVCLSRGGVFTGVFVLLLGTVGSFVVYMIGLFRFLVH